MDRAISKWIVYVAIGLAVAYVWVNFESIRGGVQNAVAHFWH